MVKTKTINVTNEVWKMLNNRKQNPSQTFNEIIKEALLEVPEVEDGE